MHDAKLLQETLEAVVVERPEPTKESPQHLCLDRGYDNPTSRDVIAAHDYVPHINRSGDVILASGAVRYPPRRWVVERTLAWLSKCRGILVRYEKKARNYVGMLQVACILIWFRYRLTLQL